MAFTPEPEFPDLSQLITSLNNSQISNKNPALYQTIKGLIQKVQALKGLAQEDIEQIQQNILDLSNTINNLTVSGTVILPPPWMPVFDGEDGEDGFPIVGPQGPPGLDGKTIPPFCDCEYIEPPPLLAQCCPESASEFSSTSTGNIDDLDFANADLIRMNNASLATIRGLKAGRAGQRVTIVSVGAGHVALAHQNGGSAAANRLQNFATSGVTYLATAVGMATYVYDGTAAFWRLEHHDQGAFITPTFAAGDFTAGGAMTWTVAGGDIITDRFFLNGRHLTYLLETNATTTTGGVADPTLRRLLPYTTAAQSQQPCIVNDPAVGVLAFGKMFVTAAGTNINIRNGPGAVGWGLGATCGVNGLVNCEVT